MEPTIGAAAAPAQGELIPAAAGPVAPAGATSDRPYLNQLNLVRLVASIGVVATHCVEQFGHGSSIYDGALLSELHATREVFFVVSAVVLSYHYYDRPVSWDSFYSRRVRWVVLPYLIWTGVYFGLSFPRLGRFSLVKPVGPFAHEVHQLAVLSVTGIGHLYYVAMLLELYVLFPLFVWFLRKTAPVHVLLIAASIAAQVWLMSRVAQNPATNRELWNYQVYLIVGAVVGARFASISRWLWRLRWPLGFVVLAVAVLTELQFVRTVHSGVAIGAASDPFQARFIPFNLAAALGLYLIGTWWAAEHRPSLLAGMVRSGADNSYGVYLSHGVALNLLIYWHFSPHLQHHTDWPIVVVLAIAIVWPISALLCSITARTPLAWAVGRARRPWVGSPSAGRFEPSPSP